MPPLFYYLKYRVLSGFDFSWVERPYSNDDIDVITAASQIASHAILSSKGTILGLGQGIGAAGPKNYLD